MNQSMLTLRGYFIQVDLVKQGLIRRLGRGDLCTMVPVDNDRVIVITKGGAALVDLSATEVLWEIDCPTHCGALDLESQVLVLGGGSRITVWNLRTGTEALEPKKYGARSIAFRPDGRQAVSCGAGIHLWEVADGRELWHLPKQYATAVAFSPDACLVASGNDKAISLRDAVSGRELQQLAGHKTDIYSLVFSPNGRLLASAGGDGFVRLQHSTGGQEVLRFECTKYGARIAFSPNGRLLAVSSDNTGNTRLWDVISLTNPGHGTGHSTLAASPAAGSIQSRVFRCRANAVAFSPDSSTLITGHWNSVRQWGWYNDKILCKKVGCRYPR